MTILISLRNLVLRISDSSDLHYLKVLSETANACFQRIKSLPENKQKKNIISPTAVQFELPAVYIN